MNLIAAFEREKIDFSLGTVRPDTVMACVAIPGQRWEIEVFEDGHLEIEVFKSSGEIYDQNHLTALFDQGR